MKYYHTIDSFYPRARDLREVFVDRFRHPKQTQINRFVWDFWYVPGEYRLVRTPAASFFPNSIYRQFHRHLVDWGREFLGCHDISPAWLSYYVEGCRQEMHADVPHGPWAFVYSLSPRNVRYQGGETFILKPEVLNFWPHLMATTDSQRPHGFDSERMIERIQSPFNRLTVFDPRRPHGVTEVRGVEDPLEARLVIHGWFVNPRPYVTGALTPAQVARTIDPWVKEVLSPACANWRNLHGTVSLRLAVNQQGVVGKVLRLTDTLIGDQFGDGSATNDFRAQNDEVWKFLQSSLKSLRFKNARGASQITIPLVFSF